MNDTDTPTKEEFLNEFRENITIEMEDATENPHMSEDDHAMMHFKMTVKRKGKEHPRELTFHYSVGSGHPLRWIKENLRKPKDSASGDMRRVEQIITRIAPNQNVYQAIDHCWAGITGIGNFKKEVTNDWNQCAFEIARQGKKARHEEGCVRYWPDDETVYLALCNMYFDGDLDFTFEDWAFHFDYSTDSIKARDTWETCQKQRRQLDAVFRRDFEWWEQAREAIDC